jgi:hypothetical protein
MNKYIYGGALFLAFAATIFSCNKSNSSSDFYQKEAAKTPEKSTWASDEDLIKAIKGQNSDYIAILSLEDYLYDNAKLSENVIQALIEEQRVPDYVVETALVLSAPISSDALSALAVRRPAVSATVISSAGNIPASVGFAIINSSPRKVIFGNDIDKTVTPGSDDCDCGDGVITVGSNHTLVILTTSATVDPTDPNQMKPCKSENTTWTCGDVVYADLTGTDGSSANYDIQCRQSTNKCFKNPRNARKDR